MTYVNNQTDTLFADISEFQTPVTSAYTDAGYRVLSIRSNDGTYLDANFAANYQFCVNAANTGLFDFFFCYYYWRPGETGLQTHMSQVNGQGGPHPKMVSMIDLESGGNPDSDQSAAVNDEYNQLVAWLGGNDLRVIGYGNQGDLRTMWQFPGSQVDVILAGYGSNPDSPNPSLIKIAHQYTDGTDYGDGLPIGAPPWATCDMNSADGLSSTALAAAVGVGAAVPPATIVTPPVTPPVTTPPPASTTGSVTPVSTPVIPPVNPTVDQTLAYLIAELSASGDIPLTASTNTVPAPNLTLRGAINAILWITNAAVDLQGTGDATGRPFPVSTPDTILGHILSLRAEGLITQAILTDLAASLGRDVTTLRANAIASFSATPPVTGASS
jgi:hypothetical protein